MCYAGQSSYCYPFEVPMQNFLRGRLELVEAIESDVVGATYADLVLIVTAVLSACASVRWPGLSRDRQRFVELLVNHSPEDFHTTWVSVPALISGGFVDEKGTPYDVPGEFTRAFCDQEIDLTFDDAKVKYPQVAVKNLRKHSYACLIYEWLRCGYAHEYCSHENVTDFPASRRKARVSYIGRSTPSGSKRMVSFHLGYLKDLAQYHVSSLVRDPSPTPNPWWIDQQ